MRGATIINDSYNSNPEALKAMIGTLASMPVSGNGRRILVAGEMLELGSESAALHAACGKVAADSGIDVVVGVRGHARISSRPHVSDQAVFYLIHPNKPANGCATIFVAGDLVLLKASRGVKLERALDEITVEDATHH